MTNNTDFDLVGFLPYVFNQAADALSLDFQRIYKTRYGMLRTEWRVLFHLGRYGDMTATRICDMGRLHKTKVSRSVVALEKKRFLKRAEVETDRRHSILKLTALGRDAYDDLFREARDFDARIRSQMTDEEAEVLLRVAMRLAGLDGIPKGEAP